MKSLRMRFWFLRTALAYHGTPYRWGGDDPSGFDCSGLVVECLKSVGMLAEGDDLTADGLWRRYRSRERRRPRGGRLVFRFDAHERARHVAICLDRYHIIEAGGGSPTVRNKADSWRANAWVRIRPVGNDPRPTRFVDIFGVGSVITPWRGWRG